MAECTDKVVGGILAGWRYDISGITPDMRGDYAAHFDECEWCRNRRRMHRTIDLSLILLALVMAGIFLLAFGAVRFVMPKYALLLQIMALGGFLLSVLVMVLVAIATPAPLVVKYAALQGAKRVHDKLPPQIREKIPEELREKISGES